MRNLWIILLKVFVCEESLSLFSTFKSIFLKFDYNISCIGPFECTLLGIEPFWMFIFMSLIKFGKLSEIYFKILYTLFSPPETPTIHVSVHLVVFHESLMLCSLWACLKSFKIFVCWPAIHSFLGTVCVIYFFLWLYCFFVSLDFFLIVYLGVIHHSWSQVLSFLQEL